MIQYLTQVEEEEGSLDQINCKLRWKEMALYFVIFSCGSKGANETSTDASLAPGCCTMDYKTAAHVYT